MNIQTPDNISDLKEVCRSGEQIRVIGSGSALAWLREWTGKHISTKKLNQVLEFRPDDLVIRAQAGTTIEEIQSVAQKSGLTLPIPSSEFGWLGYAGTTIGGMLALGLPHYWQSSTGSIRDWIIAARTISSSGEELEFGAQVVKSVAGFDVHRALVGSRGGLLILAEITLRLFPIKLLPAPPECTIKEPCCINHGLRSQFKPEWFHLAVDASQQLIWTEQPLPNYHTIGPKGERLPQPLPQVHAIQSQLKKLCDPNGVLIEGWKS
ncbi:MAG: FAD-binding protein [Fimbriimonadaceae bacterium]|nr:MAG: FAD-binding protein [Fimbriimonadaceae bacterium]